MSIALNLTELKKALPQEVTLVAVSKTKPVSAIQEAYEAGHLDFGENYVQELVDKSEGLPKDIRWHYIGHLQSNKVKYIAPFVYLIHGVDSLKLLEEINKQGVKNGRVINCLLQIYIAEEETKFGFAKEEAMQLLSSEKLKTFDHVRIIGLMGMASNTEDVNRVEAEFEQLYSLFKQIQSVNPLFTALSCGMSGDYHIAIRHGSNMVRIGSLIFGERSYTN